MKIIDNLKQKVKSLKTEIQVLTIAYSDKRTPFLAKLVIGLTVGYLLSPIDLIPDFIPILGLLDDLIIVPLLILLSIRLIPTIVLHDARKRAVENSKNHKSPNWRAAIIIIIIWLAIIYCLYQKFGYLLTF